MGPPRNNFGCFAVIGPGLLQNRNMKSRVIKSTISPSIKDIGIEEDRAKVSGL
jgi:hypothetical protein